MPHDAGAPTRMIASSSAAKPMRAIFDQSPIKPDAADGRRRQNALAVGLVVERDIAGDDREIERPAGFADALDRLHQLAHDLRAFRIAEIEIVGRRQRLGAGRREVAPALGHGLLAAFERIGLAIARRHVRGEGERLGGMAVDAHHAGVAAGDLQRVGEDQRVVLLPDPAAAGKVGAAEHFQQRVGDVRLRNVVLGQRRARLRRGPRPVIFRRLVAELLDRQVGDFLALMDDAEAQIVGRLADDGEIEPPFVEDRLGLLFHLGPAAP